MKKGICAPLEGTVTKIMDALQTVVSTMDAAMCFQLHHKPELAPQKVPVQKPRNDMIQKPRGMG